MFVSAYSCIDEPMKKQIKKIAPDLGTQYQSLPGTLKNCQILTDRITLKVSCTKGKLEQLNEELLAVAKEGNLKRTASLLAAGASINCINEKGDTPLIESSWYGNKDVVGLLLEKKAALDIQSKRGNTALMLACDRGYYGIASMLIEAGAEMDVKDNKGWPAIIDAAANGHLKLVELLSRSGADIYALDNGSWGAEAWARKNGYDKVVTWFEEHAKARLRL